MKLALHVEDLQIAVGFLIPLAVALLTKWRASAGLKAVVNIGLTTLSSALIVVIDAGGTIVVGTFVTAFFRTYAVNIATYYGFWCPTGIAGSLAAKSPDFGIGSPPALETAGAGVEQLGEVVASAEATGAITEAQADAVQQQVLEHDIPAALDRAAGREGPEPATGSTGMPVEIVRAAPSRTGWSPDQPLEEWPTERLEQRARDLQIVGRSKMRKGELIVAIRDYEAGPS